MLRNHGFHNISNPVEGAGCFRPGLDPTDCVLDGLVLFSGTDEWREIFWNLSEPQQVKWDEGIVVQRLYEGSIGVRTILLSPEPQQRARIKPVCGDVIFVS